MDYHCLKFLLQFGFLLIFYNYVKCDAPRIIKPPSVKVAPDRVIDFKCYAEGQPKATIEWYNATTKLRIRSQPLDASQTSIHINPNQGLLTMMGVEPKVTYELYCNASNADGSVISEVVKGGLAYLDNNFKREPLSKIASIGNKVIFYCEPPDGYPKPEIQWLHNNISIKHQESLLSFSHQLLINKVQLSDAGTYVCVAVNEAGKRYSKPVQLKVNRKTQFKEVPVDVNVAQGETAEFVCKALENISVNWKRKDHPIDTSRTTLTNSSLVLKNVNPSDAGTYICEISNKITAAANLTVEFGPEFLNTPEDKEVDERSNVVLNCVVVGYPKPILYWMLPSNEFVFPDSTLQRFKLDDKGSLTIYDVQLQDEGEYECLAAKKSIKIRSSATVKVIKSAKEETYFDDKFLPNVPSSQMPEFSPIIELPPANTTATQNDEVTFSCKVRPFIDSNDNGNSYLQAQSLYQISWARATQSAGGILEAILPDSPHENGRIYVSPDGNLVIKNALFEDIGNYTCMVDNKFLPEMKSNWTATLNVVTRYHDNLNQRSKLILPRPRNLQVEHISDSMVNLKWDAPNPPADLGHRVDPSSILYQVEFFTVGNQNKGWQIIQTRWDRNFIHVKQLSQFNKYYFLVRPILSYGNFGWASQPYGPVLPRIASSKDQLTRGNQQLTREIQNVEIRDIEANNLGSSGIRIKWKVDEKDVIGGFTVKYREVALMRCISDLTNSMQTIPYENTEYCSLSNVYNNKVKTSKRIEYMQNELQRTFLENSEFEFSHKVPYRKNAPNFEVLLTKMKPFRCYEYEIEPYSIESDSFGSVKGRESAANTILTYESIPSSAPDGLCVKWLNATSIYISWNDLPVEDWNALLTSYIISITDKSSSKVQTFDCFYGKNNIVIKKLNGKGPFHINIAAKNCRDRGRWSKNFVLLKVDSSQYGIYFGTDCQVSDGLKKKGKIEMAIKITSIILTLLFAILGIGACISCLFCKRKKMHKKNLSFQQNLHTMNGTSSQLSNAPILAEKETNYHLEPLLNGNNQCTSNASNTHPLPPSYHSSQSPQLGTICNGNDYSNSNNFTDLNGNTLYSSSALNDNSRCLPHMMNSTTNNNSAMLQPTCNMNGTSNGYASYNVLASSGSNGLPMMAPVAQPGYLLTQNQHQHIEDNSSVAPYATASIIPNLMVTNNPRLMLAQQNSSDFSKNPNIPSPSLQQNDSQNFSPIQNSQSAMDYNSQFTNNNSNNQQQYASHSSSSCTGGEDTLPNPNARCNIPIRTPSSSVSNVNQQNVTSIATGNILNGNSGRHVRYQGDTNSSSGGGSCRSKPSPGTLGQQFNHLIPPPPSSPPPPCPEFLNKNQDDYPYENEAFDSDNQGHTDVTQSGWTGNTNCGSNRPGSSYAYMQ